MRLNGIHAAPGTVIGIETRTERFLAIDHYEGDTAILRYATSIELTAIGTREPRSVTEHLGIPQRMTPFGPARMFGPRPYVKPKVINKREAKRILAMGSRWNPEIIEGA